MIRRHVTDDDNRNVSGGRYNYKTDGPSNTDTTTAE